MLSIVINSLNKSLGEKILIFAKNGKLSNLVIIYPCLLTFPVLLLCIA